MKWVQSSPHVERDELGTDELLFDQLTSDTVLHDLLWLEIPDLTNYQWVEKFEAEPFIREQFLFPSVPFKEPAHLMRLGYQYFMMVPIQKSSLKQLGPFFTPLLTLVASIKAGFPNFLQCYTNTVVVITHLTVAALHYFIWETLLSTRAYTKLWIIPMIMTHHTDFATPHW